MAHKYTTYSDTSSNSPPEIPLGIDIESDTGSVIEHGSSSTTLQHTPQHTPQHSPKDKDNLAPKFIVALSMAIGAYGSTLTDEQLQGLYDVVDKHVVLSAEQMKQACSLPSKEMLDWVISLLP